QSGVGHADFNQYQSSVPTNGLVGSQLGSDGLPVFLASHSAITSSTTFAQWYQTTPGVNVYVPGTLTLTNIGSSTYQFNSSSFYPLDGLGFNGDGSGNEPTPSDGLHNLEFTTELRFTGAFT